MINHSNADRKPLVSYIACQFKLLRTLNCFQPFIYTYIATGSKWLHGFNSRGEGGTFEQNLENIFSSLWKIFYSLQVIWCWKVIVFSIHEMCLNHKTKSHFYVTNIYLWQCIMYNSAPCLGYIWTDMGNFWTQIKYLKIK